jgi:hypothetical protein
MNCADVITNAGQIKVKLSSKEYMLTEKCQDKSKVWKSFHEVQGGGTKEKISTDQRVKCQF